MSVPMTRSEREELEGICRSIRKSIIHTIADCQAGHTGGSLSEVEMLVALYFRILRIDPKDPAWPERDRFVLSKGHASPGLYCVLARRGYFGEDRLGEFDAIDSMLQGHPCMVKTPGVDFSTGSLGQGLSAGIGMALGRDARCLGFHVYVLLGDGELQEGQVWEAAMYAGKHGIKGLIVLVDNNRVQLSERTDNVLDLEPLGDKWEAFGWRVSECDGHDIEAVVQTIEMAHDDSQEGPVVVIAHTVKGKGVSFMEGKCEWHAKAPTEEERQQALDEIDRDHA